MVGAWHIIAVRVTTLNQPERPDMAKLLQPDEIFVHLAVARDRGTATTSYLTVMTREPTVPLPVWTLPPPTQVGRLTPVTEEQRLQQMIDELRRMRERCEPRLGPTRTPIPALLERRVRPALDY